MKQMSWQEYYDGFYEWSPSTQKKYTYRLTGYGPAEEVWEVAQELECYDSAFAAKFLEKAFAAGVRFTPDQINYLRNTAASMETLNKSLEEKNRRMQELQLEFNPQERAMVQVRGEVYPGTTIIIGDSSMQVKSTYHYCRFERIDGDVKSTPL